MPRSPHLELFSLGQEFALVIPRPLANQATSTLYNGASENDLVGFVTAISNELSNIRSFWEQPTSRTWTFLLLSGGGLAIYLLCKKKNEDENLYVPGINSQPRRVAGSGILNGWGQRGWFGWFFDLVGDPDPPTILGGQYFGHFSAVTRESRPLAQAGFFAKIDPRFLVAPCPNCLKGTCKIRKHRQSSRHLLTVTESNTSSSSTSPMRVHVASFIPCASTPDLADDEDSDNEGVLQRVSNFQRFKETTSLKKDIRDREAGDGEQLVKMQSSGNRRLSDRSSSKSKHRIPPEGREKISSPSKKSSSRAKNLGCGDVNCNDSFCKIQMGRLENDTFLNSTFGNIDREMSVDSLSSYQHPRFSKGMVGLIKGAREVRRLIREASFDSTASEFSIGLSIPEELCDADRSRGYPTLQMSGMCAGSDLDSIQDFKENIQSESEESQIDFRLLHRKCASSYKQKRLWRLSAQPHPSDFESPEHNSKLQVEEIPSAYSSPHHEWQDLRPQKYKLALYGSRAGSKTQSSSVSEISEPLDGLEWDSEDFGPMLDDASSELSFCVDKWLDDNLELDLEAELSRYMSERSSRRNSVNSDLDSSYIYKSIRLPPSGRSSVNRGGGGYDSSSGETPQKSLDNDMLISSFCTSATSVTRPSNISYSKRGNSSSGMKSPLSQHYRWKESSPIYDVSRLRHHASGQEQTTVTTSNTGCLLATTPLSPVHEAKEPRLSSRSELLSPSSDDYSIKKLDFEQSTLPDCEVFAKSNQQLS